MFENAGSATGMPQLTTRRVQKAFLLVTVALEVGETRKDPRTLARAEAQRQGQRSVRMSNPSKRRRSAAPTPSRRCRAAVDASAANEARRHWIQRGEALRQLRFSLPAHQHALAVQRAI